MPYISKWLVEDRVMLNLIVGKLSTDEVKQGVAASIEIVKQSTSPVIHSINDLRFMTGNLMSMSDSRDLGKEALKYQTGFTVMFSNNQLMNFLSRTVMQLAGKNFRTFTSVADGFEYLATVAPELTDMLDAEAYEAMVAAICEKHGVVPST